MATNELKAPVRALAEFIEEQFTRKEVKKVYQEWPRANERLEIPSISIVTAGQPRITPEITTVIDENLNDTDKTLLLLGEYDLDLQLDFWGSYKKQREDFYDKISDIFTSQLWSDGAQGLSLKLKDYPIKGYSEGFARFELESYNYLDGPDMTSKSEWRISLGIMAHYDKMRVVDSHYMENIRPSYTITEGPIT